MIPEEHSEKLCEHKANDLSAGKRAGRFCLFKSVNANSHDSYFGYQRAMKNIAANSMPMIQVLRLISLILPVKSLMKM